jgi:hypothetical protein
MRRTLICLAIDGVLMAAAMDSAPSEPVTPSGAERRDSPDAGLLDGGDLDAGPVRFFGEVFGVPRIWPTTDAGNDASLPDGGTR